MKKCYLVLAVLTIMLLAISCGPTTPPPNTLDYEVLREWDIPAGGIGMELLVSETATKEEVLALANSLRSKYLPRGSIFITIFDSKEAYTRIDDPTYPEEEYFKHLLVSIGRNPNTGYDEILWVAEGRGH